MAYVINIAEEVNIMPRMDRTGPMGLGAGTGLGRGKCANDAVSRQEMRCGRGYARRMGLCRMARENSKEELLTRKAMLQEALNIVEAEIVKM